jgi:hypothetical protein
MDGIRNVMNSSGWDLIVARCNVMTYENRASTLPMIPRCGDFEPEFLSDSTEEQIIDFLDGRTHGEDLLHALYDRVLDEPVPERMRALFK